ncbi:2-phospho-L-lactate transferase CofD family protein [Couchioplanes caeruleus]|uniref:gluconeogenesis factor YvcK family protein n=1 Tax=Couchioplanes caeruleus TaxID=56438 RepID=UPI0020C1804A|nr:2-phospho-L-lactate transferase CofD family protein [Couchioplanes caeruleus]UQU68661.1 2-phospho-L-lactate transferase CofD family protein [Couchioplanes caeruleus]
MKVVAFGGGHGLAASLRALRHCEPKLDLDITAVVTVGDNGGSSGRLRAERDAQLPPGDLRMALTALADEEPAHQVMVRLMQHRFAPVGNPDRRAAAHAQDEASGPGGRSATAADPTGGSAEAAGPVEGSAGAAGPAGPTTAAAGPVEGSEAGAGGKSGWGSVDRRVAALGGKHDPLAGHAVGNLLLLGLLELMDDPVDALRHAAAMVGARGQVLPMACHAVGIEADVRGGDPARPGEVVTVRGQHAVAVAGGHVEAVRIVPASPPACPAALDAIGDADWLIFGPGSWYTSVLPHLLVPELAAAIVASPARRLVTLNLAADTETLGLSVADHLAALHWYLPQLHVDTVLADAKWVGEPDPVHRAAEALGARLVLAPLAVADGSPRHDPESLGAALVPVLGSDR